MLVGTELDNLDSKSESHFVLNSLLFMLQKMLSGFGHAGGRGTERSAVVWWLPLQHLKHSEDQL